MKKAALFPIALGIAVSAVASPAYAFQLPPEVYIQTSYYSDPGHNYLVGQFREYCDGHTAHWGTISMYDYNEYNICP
jgi:hypothetical protein